jgi:hypothetical protein
MSKRKKLIINADSSQLEVIVGEVENEKVTISFGQSYKIAFDTQQDWKGFVKYIVQLSPTEKINSILKPLLQSGDLIQWDDGAIGLVAKVFLNKDAPRDISRVKFFGEQEDMLWLYSVKWNDRNELSIISHDSLMPRKFDKHVRWKLLSRVRTEDEE